MSDQPFVCPFCQEDTAQADLTPCDECEQPVCIWCVRTITSEDVVCPDCYEQYHANQETA